MSRRPRTSLMGGGACRGHRLPREPCSEVICIGCVPHSSSQIELSSFVLAAARRRARAKPASAAVHTHPTSACAGLARLDQLGGDGAGVKGCRLPAAWRRAGGARGREARPVSWSHRAGEEGRARPKPCACTRAQARPSRGQAIAGWGRQLSREVFWN